MNLKPVGERCLIQVIKTEEKKGGVILLKNEDAQKYGLVLAIGKDSPVELEDVVLIPKYCGHRIEEDGEEYAIIGNDEILAVKYEL